MRNLTPKCTEVVFRNYSRAKCNEPSTIDSDGKFRCSKHHMSQFDIGPKGSGVAQSVERPAVNRKATGSRPVSGGSVIR